MRRRYQLPSPCLYAVAAFLLFAPGRQLARAQEAPQKPAEKPATRSSEKTASTEKPENPAQIELLETKVRFETNGDSRKEVHALVKINSELGVRQFARLNFDFNRSFESVEIPMVHITHASGGTADILPGAITDQPNPAVVNAPAYQDVRVKSVRILGLQPGDTLEYRVIRTISHHPLAPDFWLDHTFDRTGVVSQELFELSLPASRKVHFYTSAATPATKTDEPSDGSNLTTTYRWKHSSDMSPQKALEMTPSEPEIVVTTFESWQQLATRLAKLFETSTPVAPAVYERASALVRAAGPSAADSYNPGPKIEALYDFVSQKIRTVDLPLGSTGYRTRSADDILSSGYGTEEDKFLLFAALARAVVTLPHAGFVSSAMPKETAGLARPTVFDHILTEIAIPSISWWVDPNLEVAPYGMVPSQFRGKHALLIESSTQDIWREVPPHLPFAAQQKVGVDAALSTEGALKAKVQYSLRGDNELLLRIAFHQSSKDKWKELAQLLSLTDGFRGQVTSVNPSNPYATKEPFIVEYEITQLNFLDWSKKTVRIPALLPQLGLPDAPAKPTTSAATAPIELGTPLEVETQMTLHLPAGTTAQTPTGTSVERDYATYASQYSAKGTTLTASRHIRFLLRQIPGARAADYNAFLNAVQSDEAQDFTLQSPAVPSPKPATPPGPKP